ncbi:hypothetical protein LG52_5 [Geobacillus kaustophilus]|uniref:DNA 5'-3' helicase n=1 Tax=Geobacillus kaustophilus TaxID=1462 RepID=A0A0D8BVW8_GEOKU|nr:replicative DNA helicase [Geobacillus kaustophilus]KJE28265.1 hypothetical protein LG52_5 [Geobacillus kaustophilus]
MTQRIPSKELIHRAGSERALLSICLNKPEELIVASSNGLLPDMFAVDGHKYIYMAMNYLYSKGEQLDPISILNVYTDDRAKQAIEELGGVDYIEALKTTPVANNTKLFVEHIIQASARREVYETALKVADEAIKAKDKDLSEYLMGVESKFRDITLEYQVSQEVVPIGEGVAERLKQRLLNPQEVIGLKTGWRKFDKLTQGLKAGELTIVGARSKTGKSVTLLNWSRKISVEDKVPALYIDTEMFTEEQQDRLLAMLSRVPEVEIKNGMFGRDTINGKARDKIARLQEASRMLKEAPFYHVYLPHFTPEKIVALARKYQVEYGIGLLVFDYIKLPSSGGYVGEKEYQALGYLTSTLKDIAGTLQIPVVSAVQLNRGAVKAEEIDESMIAGSDRILQLANRVCFLRWKTEEERALSAGNQRFKIAFQRGGASNLDEIDIDFKTEILLQEEVS